MAGGNILMKTFFRVLLLGLFTFLLTAAVTTAAFGQSVEEKTALYEKYTSNYAGSIDQRKIAIQAAKEYIAKYSSSASDAEIVNYLKGAIPKLEQGIEEELKRIEAAKIEAEKQARYAKFDSSVKAEKWDGAYQAGSEILAVEPNLLDVILVLGSIGLDEIAKNPPVEKYNDLTIRYAKLAIDKMNSGVTAKNYGAYDMTYKNKENALAWMNYTIGMIMYHSIGKTNPAAKKDSLNYLYAATRYESDKKQDPRIYGSIADWYWGEVTDSVAKSDALIKEQNSLNDKWNAADKPGREVIDRELEVVKAKYERSLGFERAYTERALDAYARAYQIAKSNPKITQKYKDVVLGRINDLYKFRYQNNPELRTDSAINTYIAGVMAKPMPDPSSNVEPIMENTNDANDKATQVKTGTVRTRTVSTAKPNNRK